ncbi:MAG: helix-hairpin-helix domain-containing protein [Planctomycetes bacterium]|nr:helix-hairpin-helix domain-containing protein [Planctomycetota bacterium]
MPGRITATKKTAAAASKATTIKTSKSRKSPPQSLADLENIGPAMLKDFVVLGISTLPQLARREAFELWRDLCKRTGQRHDPCVIDVFMSAISQARGDAPCPWWDFTPKRKAMQAKLGARAEPRL